MERIELGGFDAPMGGHMDGRMGEAAGMRIENRTRENAGMRLEGRTYENAGMRVEGGEREAAGMRMEGRTRENIGGRAERGARENAGVMRAESEAHEEDAMSAEAETHEGAAVRLDVGEGHGCKSETHVYFGPFEQNKTVTVMDACDGLNSAGRVLDVEVKLARVSPGRRVALGISVNEVDKAGKEHPRGFRSVTLPAHHEKTCCEVCAPLVRFILPEDLRPEGNDGMCSGRRHFVIRTDAQYVDGNKKC